MNTIIGLLAAAGVTFGIQNKVPFIHGKIPLLDRMLRCTYCTGFHAGWIVAIALMPVLTIPNVVMFAFAAAIFSYALDELIKYFEAQSFDGEHSEEEVSEE